MIPELQSFFKKILPPKQLLLLKEFDKLLKDYNDHQSQLHSKLVTIMKERVAFYATKFLSMNWDDPDPKDLSTEPRLSNYIIGLVKETTNLYKVLIKYLSISVVKSIMTEIFQFYDVKLEEEFKKINFYTSAGKGRLLKEVEYYLENLGSLSLIDGPGNHLEIVVNNIKIKDPLSVNETIPAISSQPANAARKATLFFNMRKS